MKNSEAQYQEIVAKYIKAELATEKDDEETQKSVRMSPTLLIEAEGLEALNTPSVQEEE
jgi:hypothetical protein